MDQDVLSAINLVRVFSVIEEKAWSALSKTRGKQADDLNARQVKAMMFLVLREKENGEPFTLQQLANSLAMKKAAASLMISNMEDKKLLFRKIDKQNRRYIRIQLTPKGRKQAEAVLNLASKKIAEVLNSLKDADRKSFMQIATQIYSEFGPKLMAEEPKQEQPKKEPKK